MKFHFLMPLLLLVPMAWTRSAPDMASAPHSLDLKAGKSERIRKSSGDVVWIPAGRPGTDGPGGI